LSHYREPVQWIACTLIILSRFRDSLHHHIVLIFSYQDLSFRPTSGSGETPAFRGCLYHQRSQRHTLYFLARDAWGWTQRVFLLQASVSLETSHNTGVSPLPSVGRNDCFWCRLKYNCSNWGGNQIAQRVPTLSRMMANAGATMRTKQAIPQYVSRVIGIVSPYFPRFKCQLVECSKWPSTQIGASIQHLADISTPLSLRSSDALL